MAKRTGWRDLSQATRDRYTRAAERGTLTGSPTSSNRARSTAYNYWRSGGDLRAARGHAPRPSVPTPVAAAAAASAEGRGGNLEAATLRVWRETAAPGWIPPSRAFLADDAAAALAQLPNPRGWGNVHFTPQDDGRWRMVVERKNGGYDVQTILPDQAAAKAVMAVLSGIGPGDDWDGWDDYGDWWDSHDFDVADTDTVS